MSCPLLAIPDELILAITTPYLSNTSIIHLRATCHRLADLLDSPFQERRGRLYLHPCSIASAVEFLTLPDDSSSPFACPVEQWRHEITEIVLLGRCEPSMKTRQRDDKLGRDLDFHPWDQFLPRRNEAVDVTYEKLLAAEGKTLAENYAVLLDGLRRLPNARTLRYAGSVEAGGGPGFCGVSDETIERHSKGRDSWRASFGGESQLPLSHASKTEWWSDAQVLVAVLDAIGTYGMAMERVELLQPMPAVQYFWALGSRKWMWQLKMEEPCKIWGSVRSVKVTGPGQWGWGEYLETFLRCMASLEELEIDIKSRIDDERMKLRINRRQIGPSKLWEEEEVSTERFDMEYFASGTTSLRRLVVRNWSKYPYGLRADELSNLLEKHTESLKEVELRNILPYVIQDVGLEGAGIYPHYDEDEGIDEIVEVMKTRMRLEKAVLRVFRPGCVDLCTPDEHNDGCSEYLSVDHDYLPVARLEEIARDREINLHEGYWDFAVHIVDR